MFYKCYIGGFLEFRTPDVLRDISSILPVSHTMRSFTRPVTRFQANAVVTSDQIVTIVTGIVGSTARCNSSVAHISILGVFQLGTVRVISYRRNEEVLS